MKRGYAVVYSETSELTPDMWRILAGVLREKHRRESEHLLYNSDSVTGENTMSERKPTSGRVVIVNAGDWLSYRQSVNPLASLRPEGDVSQWLVDGTDQQIVAGKSYPVDIPLNLGAPDDEDEADE